MADIGNIPPTGVWDQVVIFGQYQHETVNGKPCLSIHDATTCTVMMDDFAAHPNCDIFYDKQHEVDEALGEDALDREKMLAWAGDGHALAWANAMVMIIGGQVTRYEPHPGAPQTPPRADDVLVQSNGVRRADGVYCLRSEVTPRGADPVEGLDNFRQTSPYYVPERDGNRLLNLTATNDPRMRGCALAFSREGGARIAMSRVSQAQPPAQQAPRKEESMKPEEMKRLMEAAGCKDEDKPEEKFQKMTAHAAKMEETGKASEMARKKFEDEASEMKRAKMEADEKEEKEKAAKMEADKAKDGEKTEMQAMQREVSTLRESRDELRGHIKKLQETADQFVAMQRGTAEKEAQAWAAEAVAMRRVRPLRKGSEEATVAWLAGERIKDAKIAEDHLEDKGTYGTPEASAMARLTAKGAGKGAPEPEQGDANSPKVQYRVAMNRARAKVEEGKDPVNYPKDGDLDAMVKRDEPAVHAAQWGIR